MKLSQPLPPHAQTKLTNWIARRINEVLSDDTFHICFDTAKKLLEIYRSGSYSMADLLQLFAATLVKATTMTKMINQMTPEMRVLRSHELLNELLIAVTEDKCIAVAQVLTEP